MGTIVTSSPFRRRPEENYEYAAKASSGIYSSIPLYTVQDIKSSVSPPPRKMSSQASAFYRDLMAAIKTRPFEKKSIVPQKKNLQFSRQTTQIKTPVLPSLSVKDKI